MDQALEALRRAGFTRIEESTSQLCPAVIDDRIIEIGQVCQQSLPPGQPNRRATLIRLTVQRADPRKGLVGTPREWRLLPKTEGMIEQDALAALHEAGFTDRQRIIIMYVSDSNCPPGRVCRMDPSGHSRLSVTSSLRLVIGK
jgi:beta-lactam-binding protein with PASTA domain